MHRGSCRVPKRSLKTSTLMIYNGHSSINTVVDDQWSMSRFSQFFEEVLSVWCLGKPVLPALIRCRNHLGRQVGGEMGQKNRLVSDTGIVGSSPALQTHSSDYTLSIVCFHWGCLMASFRARTMSILERINKLPWTDHKRRICQMSSLFVSSEQTHIAICEVNWLSLCVDRVNILFHMYSFQSPFFHLAILFKYLIPQNASWQSSLSLMSLMKPSLAILIALLLTPQSLTSSAMQSFSGV